MNTNQNVVRDERTEAVENVCCRWGASFVCFALLIDVICRGLFFNEQAWDLVALACVPGFFILINHARQKTLILVWPLWNVTLLVFVALIIGVIVSITLTTVRAQS